MCSAQTLLITGGILQGTSGYLGAQSEADNLNYKAGQAENQAQIKDIQAEQVQEAGATQQSQIRLATSKQLATNAASTAGAGIDVGGATAKEVSLSTELAGVSDIIQSHINTKRKVYSLKSDAQALRQEAGQLKKAAKRTRQLAPIRFLAPSLLGVGQANLANSKGTK